MTNTHTHDSQGLGFTVEMIHDDEFIGTFQIESIYEMNTIASFHAKEYVEGLIEYQICSNLHGGCIDILQYRFKNDKAIRLNQK